jgi:hypothetical protein
MIYKRKQASDDKQNVVTIETGAVYKGTKRDINIKLPDYKLHTAC